MLVAGGITSTAEYFGALGRQLINATGGPVYDGHDQVGSAVLTTDAQSGSNNGARMSRRYFTAFGERVAELGEGGSPPAAWAATTFGYCGAFGYEGSAEWPTESNFGGASGGGSGGSSGGGSGGSPSSDNFWESDLGVLHVGARWYWPETGRFLQRDPIGLRGGANAYVYSRNRPTFVIDPRGEESFNGLAWLADGISHARNISSIVCGIRNKDWQSVRDALSEFIADFVIEYGLGEISPTGAAAVGIAGTIADGIDFVSQWMNEICQNLYRQPPNPRTMSLTDPNDSRDLDKVLDRMGKQGLGNDRGIPSK
ncbi:MAG: RHS repeat-associated core domain-containing protein [Phycisphaerae bacterium]